MGHSIKGPRASKVQHIYSVRWESIDFWKVVKLYIKLVDVLKLTDYIICVSCLVKYLEV